MIPFDFEYYKPTTVTEAVDTYKSFQNQGKKAIFYCGGTEFITFSRINKMFADAVIDLKGVPECHVMELQGDLLVIGAAVSLNKISEANFFPLLSQAVKKVADHTSRNKITIGGNLNSRLIYREGILPLLLAEAKVKIAGTEGVMILPLEDIFNKEMNLESGQFLVQILIDKAYVDLQYVSLKKTKISKVGYPLVSIAALVKDKQIRAAFSGVCEYPFRSSQVEAALNDTTLSANERIENAVKLLPSPIVEDIQGSAEYREFVLKNTLLDTIEALKEAIS